MKFSAVWPRSMPDLDLFRRWQKFRWSRFWFALESIRCVSCKVDQDDSEALEMIYGMSQAALVKGTA